MERRAFVRLLAATPLSSAFVAPKPNSRTIPKYKLVSPHKASAAPGIPGPYPGRVISVKSAKCLDASGDHINAEVVTQMMTRGMTELTGDKDVRDSWRRFISPDDIVGIKVNVGGYPWVISSPSVINECIRNLMAIGLKPNQIYIYERFQSQMDEANYQRLIPEGIQIHAAEGRNERADNRRYDPAVYAEASFFGEEDTRSNMMRLISQRLTKIINIPNMKDHGATGVTGCLKNIAYGGFSNVARTHQRGVTHTYSFVPTLVTMEPLRSKVVLNIMDGIRGCWHGGPFARTKKYVFYPKQLWFGTDPVAQDKLLVDVIDAERKRHNAISIWDRNEKTLDFINGRNRDKDPNVNIIIREPAHVDYAAKLGLGIADLKQILLKEFEI
ncbi:MAG: DUF362 domain-containing protein [Acidobacteriota bacterium]|nr:DUF362 domain-containing protein [Acidobacteriota bacterium]